MSKLLTISFVLVSLFSIGQQVPFYNHYMLNPGIMNPSKTGISEFTTASLVRNQRYSGFGLASSNNYLSIDGGLFNEKMGFGLFVAHNSQGIQQQISANLNYSYGVQFDKSNELRFGVSAGYMDHKINTGGIQVAQEDDPFLISLRPQAATFDMNIGVSFLGERFSCGLSVPQVMGGKAKYDKKMGVGYYRLARHFMGEVQYAYPINRKVVLKPNLMVRFVPGAPIQYEFLTQIEKLRLGWASISFKSDYAIQANIGVFIKEQFKVGYSYELPVGNIRKYSSGMQHEVYLAIQFGEEGQRGKTIIKVQEKVVEKEVTDPKLQKRVEELERQVALLEKEAANQEETTQNPVIDDTTSISDAPMKDLPVASGYHFIELDNTDSKDGFYVISGVFSNKSLAESKLAEIKKRYPGAYLVVNKKNSYFYVVLLYTLEQKDAEKTYKDYKRATDRKAWMLNYIKPKD
jgi:type IX secretion system PorP/SprF family membrane protein